MIYRKWNSFLSQLTHEIPNLPPERLFAGVEEVLARLLGCRAVTSWLLMRLTDSLMAFHCVNVIGIAT
jgi:hypothetical protein